MDTKPEKRVHKIVLTGGPCGGKTTGQSRLCTFFENLGWKGIQFCFVNICKWKALEGIPAKSMAPQCVYLQVFRVPETATVLLSGGIKFSDLSADEAFKFQENLLKTMIQIENTFSELGQSCERNCLIICDRGAMDASAFISKDKWEQLIASNHWNNVELRDNRYNHIVHMVSAANGAEDFYSTEDHACRSEGVELARELDYKAAAAWIGHPYFDVIDNTTDFESKMKRMIASVCQKIGLDIGDRLECNSRKLKFLVTGPLIMDKDFPPFQDFDVVHNYLQSNNRKTQARLRKRGQKDHWSYTYTIRKPQLYGQSVEVKTQLTHRDYINMLSQKDGSHFTILKKRRCFIINNQYYQLDIYQEPGHPRCKGLMLLETYSAHEKSQLLDLLPQFLNIEKEVTGNPDYSMFNLSLKEDWNTSKQFCRGLMTNDKEESSFSQNSNSQKITNGTDTRKQQSNTKMLNGGSTEDHICKNGTCAPKSNGTSNGTSMQKKTNGVSKNGATRAINGKV